MLTYLSILMLVAGLLWAFVGLCWLKDGIEIRRASITPKKETKYIVFPLVYVATIEIFIGSMYCILLYIT